MSATFEIGGRAIGAGEPVLVVAELSASHNGDLEEAVHSYAPRREGAASVLDRVSPKVTGRGRGKSGD